MAKSGGGICKSHFLKSLSPVVLHSVKIWNQFRRSFSFTDLSQATPITKNHMFAPSLIDDVFNGWSRRGMVSLSDLYIDSNFASFEQLVQRYLIPKVCIFKPRMFSVMSPN